jgi:hypothetical protein
MTFNEKLLENYRTYPGEVEWELQASDVLELLWSAGMRRNHRLVDVGCGPLRIGKSLIAFLDAGCYTGIEPEGQILAAGIEHELGSALAGEKRPVFLREQVGESRLSAEWAVGWNVFNHLSPTMLSLALDSITARWIMDIHIGSNSFVIPTDGAGWSYRYADTKACVYTLTDFLKRVGGSSYTATAICERASGWPDFPFTTVFLLETCSTPTRSYSSTFRGPAERG